MIKGESMYYNELIDTLQNLIKFKPTQQQLADVLKIRQTAISGRAQRNSKFSDEEIKAIEAHYGVSLAKVSDDDSVILEHIHINPSCGRGTVVLDEPDVTPIRIGREIIQSVWGINNPKDLKIFKAQGDSMEPVIEDGNLLLVNTARNDVNNGGIYLLTINNDWFVKRVRKRLTGELDIISDNAHYPVETFNTNSFADVNVIGRVIKNLSKGL